jgi:curved DNA-binding protein CbpA
MTGTPDGHDHYAVLEVSPRATRGELHDAWRFKLAAYHPDRFRDAAQRVRAEEITKRVNEAWQVLGDDAARARYDRRRDAAGNGDGPAYRAAYRVPCPSCASLVAAKAGASMVVDVRCDACGEGFRAMLGARCLVRPWLERRFLGLRYSAVFGTDAGERKAVHFRRLPKELALTEGEVFSIAFHPRRGAPVYAVVHSGPVDLAWKVA